MTVYVLTVDNEVVGVYDEYTKAYDIGYSKYDGDFDIDEFEVEQKCVFHQKKGRQIWKDMIQKNWCWDLLIL